MGQGDSADVDAPSKDEEEVGTGVDAEAGEKGRSETAAEDPKDDEPGKSTEGEPNGSQAEAADTGEDPPSPTLPSSPLFPRYSAMSTLNLYDVSKYTFGTKEEKERKGPKLVTGPAIAKHLEERYRERGMRRSVGAVLLIQNQRFPHILLLKSTQRYTLPGGRLRPGESDVDGLKRKLANKLSPPTEVATAPRFEIGEQIANWWSPDFSGHTYPYVPAHVAKPKESHAVYVVQLPESCAFAVPKNLQLLAVPLFEIYDNMVTNRTLPAHPEYTLPQSEQWLKELRRISGRCLFELEEIKAEMERRGSSAKGTGISEPALDGALRPLEMDPTILRVFGKMARGETQRGVESIGLLAGKLTDIAANVRTLRVAALVMPRQEGSTSHCEMLNENEYLQLQEEKGLFTIGWIVTHPNGEQNPTHVELRHHAAFQAMLPESVLVTSVPSPDPGEGNTCYALTDPGGLGYALRAGDRTAQAVSATVPPGFKGAGKPLFLRADHVRMQPEPDNKPRFKVRLESQHPTLGMHAVPFHMDRQDKSQLQIPR